MKPMRGNNKVWKTLAPVAALLLLAAPALAGSPAARAASSARRAASSTTPAARPAAPPAPARTEKAVFAMGCFWCAEATFEGTPGVLSVISGYSGGEERNPAYEDVSAGRTHHRESIEVTFDPTKTSYPRLLDIFWRNVDPTQNNGQFCDHGAQYRAAIFPMNEEQRKRAEASKEALVASKRFRQPIVTDVLPFRSFWPAEEYHQDYYKKNPANYHSYRLGCGRDRRLQELWGAGASEH